MRLTIRILGAAALVLVLVGLGMYLSAASLSGAASLARQDSASSVTDLAGKVALIIALIAAFVAWQREQGRWFGALLVAAALTLFAGLLGALTNTGVVLYFLLPMVAALLTLAYTMRMRDAPHARAWWLRER
ncbi:MAG: hypothetical protein KGO05_02945 [Chloroflexota bacterium]|nr:hypothetical protein [Chloroflexota bacterium]